MPWHALKTIAGSLGSMLLKSFRPTVGKLIETLASADSKLHYASAVMPPASKSVRSHFGSSVRLS